jgi:hypothetical protein
MLTSGQPGAVSVPSAPSDSAIKNTRARENPPGTVKDSPESTEKPPGHSYSAQEEPVAALSPSRSKLA